MDLVDSSVLIEFLLARPGAARDHMRAALAADPGPGTSQPVLMEVLAGPRTPRQLHGAQRLLEALPMLTVEPATDYSDAAALYRGARRNGRTIRKMNDCLIAAVALRNGARVVHRDGDFEAIAAVSPLRTLDLR